MKRMKKVLTLAVCALMSFATLVPKGQEYVFAESSTNSFNKVEDFSSSYIENDIKNLGVDSFAQRTKTDIEVVAALEYCYSDNFNFASKYYDFFIYIYIPSRLRTSGISNVQGDNKVQMSTSFDSSGQPITYEKKALTFCDKTDDNAFYKFKITYSANVYQTVKNYENLFGVRRYDISGVELKKSNTDEVFTDEIQSVEDIKYEKTFLYEGYAKNCSNESMAASTLKCHSTTLETIALELNHTYWRSDDKRVSEGIDRNDFIYEGDQVNTVYFSVPEKYFEKYGNLQKIRAEWLEYKTKPIFVTSDEGAYEELKNYIGKKKNEALNYRIFWDETVLSFGTAGVEHSFNSFYNSYAGFNYNTTNVHNEVLASAKETRRIDWLFFDKNAENAKGKIESKTLTDYITNYTRVHNLVGGAKIQTNNGSISSELFEEGIDADRQHLIEESKGYGRAGNYIQQEIDAGEKSTVFDLKQSFWESLFNKHHYEELEINPITQLDDSIKSMNNAVFASKYKINSKDANDVFNYSLNALDSNCVPVIFHFAVTDYYYSDARFDMIKDDNPFGTGNMFSEQDGFVAQETMFFDFDIITLTFRSAENVDTIIPVCSNPINIITDIETPPVENRPEWMNPSYGYDDTTIPESPDDFDEPSDSDKGEAKVDWTLKILGIVLTLYMFFLLGYGLYSIWDLLFGNVEDKRLQRELVRAKNKQEKSKARKATTKKATTKKATAKKATTKKATTKKKK